MSSTTFQIPTSWGLARITTDGPRVVELRPPVRLSPEAASSTEPLSAGGQPIPQDARTIAQRLVRYFDEGDVDALRLTDEELGRILGLLEIEGFRARVMQELARVPAGETVSYGQLAAAVGNPGAARAVGTVCAQNPLPIIVPCHRVVAASGKLGAFSFEGPEYKSRLLAHEGVRVGGS